jgi:hypothetical protein
MTHAYRLMFFNDHIDRAQAELRQRARMGSEIVRRLCAETAMAHLRCALRLANQLQCKARKAVCLRVLNWIKADLRRSA